MYPIKIKRLPGYDDITFPQRMSDLASGYDICAGVDEEFILKSGKRALIPTGFAIEMPQGIEAQIRPRSGLALKHGVTILNTPGTVDADYRGHVQVIVVNLGNEDFLIKRGERIAQLVFMEIPKTNLIIVEELDETERGSGGFGHTGR